MSHGTVGDDVVAVAAPLPVTGQTTRSLEVLHDALDRSFGDAHLVGEVSETQLRVSGQTDEHVAVVRQERPRALIGVPGRRAISGNGSSSHESMLRTLLPELTFC